MDFFFLKDLRNELQIYLLKFWESKISSKAYILTSKEPSFDQAWNTPFFNPGALFPKIGYYFLPLKNEKFPIKIRKLSSSRFSLHNLMNFYRIVIYIHENWLTAYSEYTKI